MTENPEHTTVHRDSYLVVKKKKKKVKLSVKSLFVSINDLSLFVRTKSLETLTIVSTNQTIEFPNNNKITPGEMR